MKSSQWKIYEYKQLMLFIFIISKTKKKTPKVDEYT